MKNEKEIRDKELQLEERLAKIKSLEEEIKKKEKALKASDCSKKQVPLRLAPSLWEAISKWAEEDFRSINGQIEYILTDAVRNRKK